MIPISFARAGLPSKASATEPKPKMTTLVISLASATFVASSGFARTIASVIPSVRPPRPYTISSTLTGLPLLF